MKPMVRLYVDHPLGQGDIIALDRAQAHYLFGVMRLGVGDMVALINGIDGEWQAQIAKAGKRSGNLECITQTRPLEMPPDLWLIFAPIKRARTDFIVEKAAEMGATRILPVQTEFTNSERIRVDRLQTHVIEAIEQCGGTFVPQVEEMQKLDQILANWPDDRQLMFCDEGLAGQRGGLTGGGGPWAILIGPEGGFSPHERARLVNMELARPVALGPRILRADTAAVAAMALWQHTYGDWTCQDNDHG